MNHQNFKEARHTLDLTQSQMGDMLGVSPQHIRRMETRPENSSHRPVNKTVARLLSIYLDGYRPDDWPDDKP